MVVDPETLMAEIEAEVRARRAAGDLPPGFERELDLAFARYVPVGAMGDDLESILGRAEQASFIDLAAPVESARPGVPLAKKLVRKVVFFNLHYVGIQITNLGLVLIRALRVVNERVARLEQSVPGVLASPVTGHSPSAAPLAPAPGLDHWVPQLADVFGGAGGRVLHAECGAGELIGRLREAGVDAYGVEPVPERAAAADDAGVEARAGEVLDHLRAVGQGVLGGLILSGCVDRLSPTGQQELAALAATRVAAGGRVAVVGTAPEAWLRTVGPVAADLAPGRPLHPETWARLLEGAGCTEIEIHRGAAGEALEPVPGDGEAAATLNANLERLNHLLFGPSTYCVLAGAPGPDPGTDATDSA